MQVAWKTSEKGRAHARFQLLEGRPGACFAQKDLAMGFSNINKVLLPALLGLLLVATTAAQGNGRDAAMAGLFRGVPVQPTVPNAVHPGDNIALSLFSNAGTLAGNHFLLVGEFRDAISPPYLQLPGEPGALGISHQFITALDTRAGISIGGLPAGGLNLNFPAPALPGYDLHMQAAVEDPTALNGLALTELNVASLTMGPVITENLGPAQTGAQFAYGVTAADLDGDGRDELVVGARTEVISGARVGRVRIYKDGFTLWRTLDDPEQGSAGANNQFGFSTGVGDFNGDGFPDVVVGARASDLAGLDQAGKAVVFYGPDFVVTQTILPPAPENRGRFAHRIATGDFDADGTTDIAIGSVRQDSLGGVVDAGAVWIFHGPYIGGSIQRVESPTPSQDANFGYRLDAADADGDGFHELLVASPFHNVTTTRDDNSGRVEVFSGPAMTSVLDFPNPIPATAGDPNGLPFIAALGADTAFEDVTGDGIPDVIVGSELDDLTFNNQGSVWILHGPDFVVRQQVVAPDPIVDGGFGSAVDVGDFDGDGITDLLVGEFWRRDTDSRQGRSIVLHGPSFTTSTSFYEPVVGVNHQFGRRVDAADLDGDGRAEAIIGTPFTSRSGNLNIGAFYVVTF